MYGKSSILLLTHRHQKRTPFGQTSPISSFSRWLLFLLDGEESPSAAWGYATSPRVPARVRPHRINTIVPTAILISCLISSGD